MTKHERLFARRERKYNTNIYLSHAELSAWAIDRHMSMPLAHALHIVANADRSADQVWENASQDEAAEVAKCLREMVEWGDYASIEQVTMPTMRG